MQEKQRPAAERRTRSIGMIRKLVKSRTEMLSLFNDLANKKPFNDTDDSTEILGDFCAALVDYTANAHFQLYRYFAENRERRSGIYNVVDRIYPRIVDITQEILDFNDKYDTEAQRRSQLNQLARDLSKLGEHLAERIELEDQLVDSLSGPSRDAAQ
jgi:regulator of sigma D